jgi:hypothetical protein
MGMRAVVDASPAGVRGLEVATASTTPTPSRTAGVSQLLSEGEPRRSMAGWCAWRKAGRAAGDGSRELRERTASRANSLPGCWRSIFWCAAARGCSIRSIRLVGRR